MAQRILNSNHIYDVLATVNNTPLLVGSTDVAKINTHIYYENWQHPMQHLETKINENIKTHITFTNIHPLTLAKEFNYNNNKLMIVNSNNDINILEALSNNSWTSENTIYACTNILPCLTQEKIQKNFYNVDKEQLFNLHKAVLVEDVSLVKDIYDLNTVLDKPLHFDCISCLPIKSDEIYSASDLRNYYKSKIRTVLNAAYHNGNNIVIFDYFNCNYENVNLITECFMEILHSGYEYCFKQIVICENFLKF